MTHGILILTRIVKLPPRHFIINPVSKFQYVVKTIPMYYCLRSIHFVMSMQKVFSYYFLFNFKTTGSIVLVLHRKSLTIDSSTDAVLYVALFFLVGLHANRQRQFSSVQFCWYCSMRISTFFFFLVFSFFFLPYYISTKPIPPAFLLYTTDGFPVSSFLKTKKSWST